ncbi:hypothetical protein SD37_22995 [Amycolatopsis orientalis]|uniref:Uncharacterized protein n=1 Tax=Amycolatopsis orientalis TaxID=31958 RepID=A0A193C1E2_AMYOR|nr:DUF6355 family natural product biosynthesis protein [Amycolatopsis orientalis]ANN18225.1 hypothetical protein SD37_22995 [Amycolatopsis orientalis]
MRLLKASTIAASVVAGMTLAGATAVAAPAETTTAYAAKPTSMEVCGFYKTAVTAYYNHCADSCIWIWVDYTRTTDGWKHIPNRGITDLGGAGDVNNAWYDHVC